MRGVVQRVKEAQVSVGGKKVASIRAGMLVLIGVGKEDSVDDVRIMADRLLRLRIFADSEGKMNLDIKQIQGSVLLVPNFTLYGDARNGHRPNFMQSAKFDDGKKIYDLLLKQLAEHLPVASGIFGASMQVQLVNDGPVTILLDSKKTF